jgi:hypothetical protein
MAPVRTARIAAAWTAISLTEPPNPPRAARPAATVVASDADAD